MEVFRDLGKTCTNAKPTNTNKENINLKYYLFISFAGNLNFLYKVITAGLSKLSNFPLYNIDDSR